MWMPSTWRGFAATLVELFQPPAASRGGDASRWGRARIGEVRRSNAASAMADRFCSRASFFSWCQSIILSTLRSSVTSVRERRFTRGVFLTSAFAARLCLLATFCSRCSAHCSRRSAAWLGDPSRACRAGEGDRSSRPACVLGSGSGSGSGPQTKATSSSSSISPELFASTAPKSRRSSASGSMAGVIFPPFRTAERNSPMESRPELSRSKCWKSLIGSWPCRP